MSDNQSIIVRRPFAVSPMKTFQAGFLILEVMIALCIILGCISSIAYYQKNIDTEYYETYHRLCALDGAIDIIEDLMRKQHTPYDKVERNKIVYKVHTIPKVIELMSGDRIVSVSVMTVQIQARWQSLYNREGTLMIHSCVPIS
jgi:Tfp pilus assembly protein PilV